MVDNKEYFKKRLFSFELECSNNLADRVMEKLRKSLINYAYRNLKVIESRF